MKIFGYEQIDSEKEGKSTHGIMVHRKVPIVRQGSAGSKTVGTWLSDQILAESGLSRSDIVDCYTEQKEIIIESYTQNGFTNIASILIL